MEVEAAGAREAKIAETGEAAEEEAPMVAEVVVASKAKVRGVLDTHQTLLNNVVTAIIDMEPVLFTA